LSYVPSKLRKKIDWLFKRTEGALLPPAALALEGAHLDPDGARLALRACEDDVAVVGDQARLAALLHAIDDPTARPGYVLEYGACGVRRFDAGPDSKTRIYQLTVETFPRHINNVYAIVEPGSAMLLDCGSGLPTSRRDLALRFAVVRAMFDEDLRWEALDWCIISHAHADHYGGANELRRSSRAKLAVHELDAHVLSAFEERLVAATNGLDTYWRRAGVPEARRAPLRDMYMASKSLFRSEPVDRVLRDGDVVGPGYVVHHVPGHCPGLICLQVHDVLLTSDHVLARITPHQFPQSIAPFAGLEHYFRSLAKIRALPGIRLALGGHEEPIHDVRTRIDAIEQFHRQRLDRVLGICEVPKSIDEVSTEMFGEQAGYGVILALDEAGAHVEYLHQLGRLRVDDLDDVVRYVAG